VGAELRVDVVVTIAIFMLVHLGAAIWFASRVNTQITEMGKVLGALALDVKAITTQDVRIAVLDQRVVACETRIRETRDMIVGQRHG